MFKMTFGWHSWHKKTVPDRSWHSLDLVFHPMQGILGSLYPTRGPTEIGHHFIYVKNESKQKEKYIRLFPKEEIL